MTKWYKVLMICLTLVLSVSFLTPETSYARDGFDTDLYDAKLKAANEVLTDEDLVEGEEDEIRSGGRIIRELIKLTFKQGDKNNTTEKVYATKKKIKTTITRHAKAAAYDDRITAKDIDRILSGKSTGIKALQTYEDTVTGGKIIVDPNSKLVVVMSKGGKNILTVYTDSGKAIKNRPNDGRWSMIDWFYGE
ncbi:hypothetical protein ACFVS2_09605 [Brevibacillus sp. NPDC058079]|uniref:hypothetical protein n=1 Tax=Brevibacillus sp. NPDC058079 TaxID=3346330 RepID=UPI0036E0E206